MPAYNEEANIENVVRQWIGTVDRITSENTDAWLVIANDGSKDTTWKKWISFATNIRDSSHWTNPIPDMEQL